MIVKMMLLVELVLTFVHLFLVIIFCQYSQLLCPSTPRQIIKAGKDVHSTKYHRSYSVECLVLEHKSL